MAALTSCVVTNRTTSGCTVTFNAAALDLTTGQTKKLAEILNKLAIEEGLESTAASFTITIPALG